MSLMGTEGALPDVNACAVDIFDADRWDDTANDRKIAGRVRRTMLK